VAESIAGRTPAWLANFVGQDWHADAPYFNAAEPEMERRWETMLWPFLEGCDFRRSVDLAAGHGRNTRKLLEQSGCETVYAVDINQDNVDFCAARFKGEPRVRCLRNDGLAIPEIETRSITLFYCFDAMVHFDSDVVRLYLREIRRLLVPGAGRAFLHHSNDTSRPGADFHGHRHWRNFMSAELMAHYAAKEGLAVEKQKKIDWNRDKTDIDAFTLLSAPA
jgi:SAM-dependent methyltransferase